MPEERKEVRGRHDEILLRISGAIADGQTVDWNLEAITDHDLRVKLGGLETLDRIRRVAAGEYQVLSETTQPTVRLQDLIGNPPTGKPTPPPEMPASWGPLRLKRRLGQGGASDVYEAFDPRLERAVALKIRREPVGVERARRYLEEARRLARVAHPNIVTIHGADVHDGRVGLWTELVQGTNLEERLAQAGPLSAREASTVCFEVCRALAAVHAESLVHGDLKLANVMREEGGRILLVDFGCAYRVSAGSLDPDAVSAGTPIFMAPELFFGSAPSARSDVYSMGVVLYRLVTGRYPVEAATLQELREAHRARRRTPLLEARPDLPQAFVRLVERALDYDPARRPAGGAELACQLDAFLTPQRSAASPSRRRRLALAAVGVVALAAALAAVVIGLGGRGGPIEADVRLFRQAATHEERLAAGAAVRAGDPLFLEIETSHDAYVYILNEDEAGHQYLLFPLQVLDTGNPLAGSVPHRLPGTSRQQRKLWRVSAGGRELLLVVVARHRLTQLEEAIAAIPQAGEFAVALEPPDAEGVVRSLRGLGELTDPPGELPRMSLARLAGELDLRGRDGIWIEEIYVHSGAADD